MSENTPQREILVYAEEPEIAKNPHVRGDQIYISLNVPLLAEGYEKAGMDLRVRANWNSPFDFDVERVRPSDMSKYPGGGFTRLSFDLKDAWTRASTYKMVLEELRAKNNGVVDDSGLLRELFTDHSRVKRIAHTVSHTC